MTTPALPAPLPPRCELIKRKSINGHKVQVLEVEGVFEVVLSDFKCWQGWDSKLAKRLRPLIGAYFAEAWSAEYRRCNKHVWKWYGESRSECAKWERKTRAACAASDAWRSWSRQAEAKEGGER